MTSVYYWIFTTRHQTPSYFLDPSIGTLTMGLGWDTPCDLDVHCYVFDEWYQKLDHVYKHDRDYPGVHHFGDDRSGHGAGVDEAIRVSLGHLPPEVKHISFFVGINAGEEYRDEDGNVHRRPPPPNFSYVRRCFAQMVSETGMVLANFTLSQDGQPGRSRLMMMLSRYGADARWQVIPLGRACKYVHNTEGAQEAIIHETRPDLLRNVSITMGPVQARDLVIKDKTSSDPYVTIKFFDHHDSKHRSKTIKKELNPEWNETELVQWSGPMYRLLTRIRAKVDIYDYDKWSLNDFMGRVMIHLRDVLGTKGRGPQQQWLTLGQKHGGEDKEVSGDILLQWNCVPIP